MDITLKDYIERVMKTIELEKKPSMAHNSDQYLVYPELESIDSDEKINPYSKV